MHKPSRSYVLCGTPRTGSTLLCNLLYSTGVLGRPESYFREPDEVAWATRFGLATEGGRVRDYRAFVNAARSAGASDNGVFGVRKCETTCGVASIVDLSERECLELADARRLNPQSSRPRDRRTAQEDEGGLAVAQAEDLRSLAEKRVCAEGV